MSVQGPLGATPQGGAIELGSRGRDRHSGPLGAGETATVLGHWVAAASTMGTFLRAFSWGHVRQLDVVSGELLKRAWQAGAG